MPLRRVDLRQAGPTAVGILVPPGAKTFVVVRPRGMMWDLLPVRWDGDASRPPEFVSFDRDTAAIVARNLAKRLEACDLAGETRLETLGHEPAFQVWLRDAELRWLLCERVPGQAYRPLVFASLEHAHDAAAKLMPLVSPGPERVQEYYFNTQNFG